MIFASFMPCPAVRPLVNPHCDAISGLLRGGSRTPALLSVLFAGFLLTGCGPRGNVHLYQPQLSGCQQLMHLTTERAYWAADNGVTRILAEFPLPGASTGDPTYLLYLRLPSGEGPATVNPKPSTAGARGFFIQIRGDYAGLAFVIGGELSMNGTGTARDALRTIEFELRCEEGSRLRGKVVATHDTYRLCKFEEDRRPADVRALILREAAAEVHAQPAPVPAVNGARTP